MTFCDAYTNISSGDVAHLFQTQLVPGQMRVAPDNKKLASEPAVVGFVVEKSGFYSSYLNDNFNTSNIIIMNNIRNMVCAQSFMLTILHSLRLVGAVHVYQCWCYASERDHLASSALNISR